MIAPVGQASRQPAFVQCLQTSLIISQRFSPRNPTEGLLTRSAMAVAPFADLAACRLPPICSTKATCRQVVAPRAAVLS